MRWRVLAGLFGVVLVSCATVPAGTCAPAAHGHACMRRVASHESPRAAMPLSYERLRAAVPYGRLRAVAPYESPRAAMPYDGAARVASQPPQGRPRDPDELSAPQVGSLLRDFTQTLRRRYGVDSDRQLESSRRLAGRVVIPVRFHVITDGRSGRLSRPVIDAQIRSLNAAYGGTTGGADTGVSFRLVSVGVVTNAAWFARPHDDQTQMLGALSRGGSGTLNLYTAAVGSDVLGFSSFPQAYRLRPGLDGVVVDYRSVPGGSFAHFNRGYTAVHEIGHWLGLFHPFEGGCTPPGDGVDDTPYESLPTLNCPAAKDTCPQPGTDLVHNFMDYAWDPCMTSFTPGQGLRIRAMWAAYRTGTGAGQGARTGRSVG